MPPRTAILSHTAKVAKDTHTIEVARRVDNHRHALDCALVVAVKLTDDIHRCHHTEQHRCLNKAVPCLAPLELLVMNDYTAQQPDDEVGSQQPHQRKHIVRYRVKVGCYPCQHCHYKTSYLVHVLKIYSNFHSQRGHCFCVGRCSTNLYE